MIHTSASIRAKLRIIVLKLLLDNRMYGYEISQKVKGILNGYMNISEGGIYPTLYVLEKEGWLVSERQNIGKRIRKYYSLSKQGRLDVLKMNN